MYFITLTNQSSCQNTIPRHTIGHGYELDKNHIRRFNIYTFLGLVVTKKVLIREKIRSNIIMRWTAKITTVFKRFNAYVRFNFHKFA
jgi:hypothetical protein